MRPLFVTAVCIAFFLACNQSPENQEYTRLHGEKSSKRFENPLFGGIYRLPLMNNPSSLDPILVQDQYGVTVIRQLFEGLVQFDPQLMVLPALAQTWRLEKNGKAYHFELRQDAQFHNGAPVTAEDVIFSIRRLIRASTPPAILPQLLKIKGAQAYRDKLNNQLDGLQPTGSHGLIIHLIEPYVPFISALGMFQAAIVPKSEVLRMGQNFGRSPIGSGPFQFVSWRQNDVIQLKRFSGYHSGAAFMDEIHFRIYPGGQTNNILGDFLNGTLHEMAVFGDIRRKLDHDSSFKWQHRPSLSLFFYGFNCGHPKLADSDIRAALHAALNRQKIITEVYGDAYDIANSILPPGMPGYRPLHLGLGKKTQIVRLNGAAALKSKLSHISPLEIVSAIRTPRVEAEMAIVQKSWAQLGIQTQAKYLTDWTEYKNYLKTDRVQVYRYAWYADLPDPDSMVSPLFESGSAFNFSRFYDPEVDAMLAEARRMIDSVKRMNIYQIIQQRIAEASPIIPLFYLSIDRVYQAEVNGVQLNPVAAEIMPYHQVWLAETKEQSRDSN